MKEERFKIIYTQANVMYVLSILEDTITGKQFILISNETQLSLCPM